MRRGTFGMIVVILLLASGVSAWSQCATEVEDNNTVALADYVAELPGAGCIEGSIGVVGDIDFYYFDVLSPRWVLIETLTNEDTEIALWDIDGNQMAQNDDIALNIYSSRIEEFLATGRYIVAVWEHGDDNVIYDYTLHISAEGCSEEVENNDSFDLADHLGDVPGEVCVTGSIGVVADYDLFSFNVTSGCLLTISTVTNEDTEIALLDVYGNVIASNDDYVVGEYWSWIEREMPIGTYYVMVWEHGDDNVIYSYTLVVQGSMCVSEVEPNDDYTLADAIGNLSGQLCASGSIGGSGDLDYFMFTVSRAMSVTLWTETTGDTEIALFDGAGNTLASNDDVSATDTSSWINIDLPVGTYYVAVREFTGADWIDSYLLYVSTD